MITLTLASLIALSGCGNSNTNTSSATGTEGTIATEDDSNSTDETEASTTADTDTEADSQAEDSYGYPDSLKSDLEPKDWEASLSTLYFKVPGIFDHEWNVSPSSFLKYTDENENKYFYSVHTSDWVENVPDWMDADHMEYTLDTVPDYMKYDFVSHIDSASGIAPDKHDSPFTMSKTEFNLETEEKVEINGEEYIKWEGTAHADNYGMDVTVYFSCYFFLLDYSTSSKFDTEPGYITVMTQDCSDAGKQLVRDAADYAVNNSSRK